MKLRIFVVDDEPSILDTITYCLTELGHEVIAANSTIFCKCFTGDDDGCPTDTPCGDVLLIDQNMPQKKGLDFIAWQKRSGHEVATTTALMSASLLESELRQARELGCDVLQKPLNFEKLTTWIEATQQKISPRRKLLPCEKIPCFKNNQPCLSF